MKKLSVFAFLALASFAACAQNSFTMPASANSNAAATGTSAATNAGVGNGANLAVNTYGGGDSTIRSAPTVYTPGLVTSFSQGSCMVSAAGGFSLVGFGASGGVPIDGEHCDFRLNLQQTSAIAMTITDFLQKYGDKVESAQVSELSTKAGKMLDAAGDMTCLYSDRMRAVLEANGLCDRMKDLATLDHRFNQPRSTQIDYSTRTPLATTRVAGN
jgi:hypothetical protein